ncbi:hypothetical protein ACWC2T_27945 [Streptomyces sp. NPDC001393]
MPELLHAEEEFIVLSLLEGTPWDKAGEQLSADAGALLRRELGAITARLHTLAPADGRFGYPAAELVSLAFGGDTGPDSDLAAGYAAAGGSLDFSPGPPCVLPSDARRLQRPAPGAGADSLGSRSLLLLRKAHTTPMFGDRPYSPAT